MEAVLANEEIIAELKSRSAKLGMLGSRIRIEIGGEHFFIDGTTKPAIIGDSTNDERPDCILGLDRSVALAFLSGEMSGCEVMSGQKLKVTGWGDGRNPMNIVYRLGVILHRAENIPNAN